jgi:HSP20 family protein
MVFGYRNIRHPLHQLRDEMDRLLTGFLGPAAEGFLPAIGRGQPAVNAWERDDALLIEMELPGVKSNQVEVSVAGGELSVRVNRPEQAEEKAIYHRRERPVGPLARSLRLPFEVDADRVSAELRDGVLTVTLPKAEAAKPRKINVVGA